MYKVPTEFCGDEWEWHISRTSIGDVVRGAAFIKRDSMEGKRHLVLCEDRFTSGIRANENFTFVDKVLDVPRTVLLHGLAKLVGKCRPFLSAAVVEQQAAYMFRHWSLRCDNVTALQLSKSDFRCRTVDVPLPARYVVLHPCTSHVKAKSRRVPTGTYATMQRGGLPIVILGSNKDRRYYKLAMPGAIDVRGKTTIGEAIWIVANSDGVVAAETWSPLLAAQLGIPSVIGCCSAYVRNYEPFIKSNWPSMLYCDVESNVKAWYKMVGTIG